MGAAIANRIRGFVSVAYLLDLLHPVQNLGSAMADVVVDAMIAEAVRVERASFAGDLQSISWMAMAFGGICGSLLGGYALTNLQIESIFLLFSVLPAVQLFSCGLIKENDIGGKVLLDFPTKKSSEMENGSNTALDADNFSVKAKTSALRRKKTQKKSKKRLHNTSKFQVPEKDGLLVSRWFQSLRVASSSLLRAFRQPIILRPMSWFFLAHITVPKPLNGHVLLPDRVLKFGSILFGYCTCCWVARPHAWNAHLQSLHEENETAKNSHVGSCWFVFLESSRHDAINQFKFMPFLILSGQLCPPGIEGTLFALFMSINNFGSTLGSFVGAGLASALNISSGSFDNLLLGVGIQVICTFIPVAFLFLIPKDATGISA
ncbi:major facilitator superfamily protein [Actinidia rufa]|uniref:Major facilitator superfamily protein n=1 Tax=Actinidia rufa TaxID=165716 RepID=A0A7J0G9L4_9ERIC|nr:major facilitator superfamily protein [Actinidia rufa]